MQLMITSKSPWASLPSHGTLSFQEVSQIEACRLTIDWAKTVGNLKFYKRHDSGGHFAAIEKPEVLVSDIREFFGPKGGAASVTAT